MTKMHRHTFLVAAGITALAHGQAIPAPSKSSSIPLQLTGNGNGRMRSYPDGSIARRNNVRRHAWAIAQDTAGIFMSARWRICILPCLHPNSDGSWTETILHSFNPDGIDGYNPYANLILDKIGNLYETTYNGGSGSRFGSYFSHPHR